MNYVAKLITIVFALIALYLVLFHGRQTVNIIGTLGRVSIEGIEALQGRS